jgi:hypothetical protein
LEHGWPARDMEFGGHIDRRLPVAERCIAARTLGVRPIVGMERIAGFGRRAGCRVAGAVQGEGVRTCDARDEGRAGCSAGSEFRGLINPYELGGGAADPFVFGLVRLEQSKGQGRLLDPHRCVVVSQEQPSHRGLWSRTAATRRPIGSGTRFSQTGGCGLALPDVRRPPGAVEMVHGHRPRLHVHPPRPTRSVLPTRTATWPLRQAANSSPFSRSLVGSWTKRMAPLGMPRATIWVRSSP